MEREREREKRPWEMIVAIYLEFFCLFYFNSIVVFSVLANQSDANLKNLLQLENCTTLPGKMHLQHPAKEIIGG